MLAIASAIYQVDNIHVKYGTIRTRLAKASAIYQVDNIHYTMLNMEPIEPGEL